MRAYLVLCVAATLVGAVRADCDACLDGLCYRKHRLPEITGLPIGIDRTSNILYYMNDISLQRCNLNTETCNTNKYINIMDVQGFTVDQRTGDVYIIHFMNYGIYKLDFVNMKIQSLLHKGMYDIAFKDKLYYSRGVPDGIFTFEEGQSRMVRGTEGYNIRRFIIDKNNDIFFEDYTNNKNVRLRRLSSGVLQDRSWDNSFSMTLDNEDNAVLVQPASRAVYRIINGQQIDIGAFNGSVYGTPLFDKDNNLIYSSGESEFAFLKKERYVHCSVSQDSRIITETAASQ